MDIPQVWRHYSMNISSLYPHTLYILHSSMVRQFLQFTIQEHRGIGKPPPDSAVSRVQYLYAEYTIMKASHLDILNKVE